MCVPILVFLCFVMYGFCNVAVAQDSPYTLSAITVTASRTESQLREAGANVTVITRKDIEQSGAENIAEIFAAEPGLFYQNSTGNPQNAKVDVRGYGEAAPQNVLFLVDGRRINNIDLAGADLSEIPLDAIERVEVYRGPASVLYGDNATGGVINIILRKGTGKPRLTVSAGAGSDRSFRSGLALAGRIEAPQGESIKNLSYYLHSSYFDTDGYRQNNGYLSRDLFGNFSSDIMNNLKIGLKAGHHKDSFGLPGYLLWNTDLNTGRYDRTDSKTPSDKGATEDNFVDMEAVVKLPWNLAFSVGGSYRDRHNMAYYEGAGWFSDWRSGLETYSFTPKLTCTTPVFGMKNSFTTGFDYYRSPSFSDSYGGAFVSNQSSIRKTDEGFYVNEKLFLVRSLFVEAGYRYQKGAYELNYTDNVTPANSYDGKKTEREEAYRLSVNYAFRDDGNIFVTYSKGFRFPVTDEFVGFDPTTFANFFNPDVKPQTTEEVDIGLRWNPLPRLGGTLTLFRAVNHDEIYYNPYYKKVFGTWYGANENYERTKRTGAEATMLVRATERLSVDVSYSYTEAKFDGGQYDGNWIPFVPRNKFGARMVYRFKYGRNKFVTSVMMNCLGSRYAVSDQMNAQRMLPGYATFDISILHTFKKLKTLLTVKNIAGHKYYEYGAYSPNQNDIGLYPAPERTYFLKLSYDF